MLTATARRTPAPRPTAMIASGVALTAIFWIAPAALAVAPATSATSAATSAETTTETTIATGQIAVRGAEHPAALTPANAAAVLVLRDGQGIVEHLRRAWVDGQLADSAIAEAIESLEQFEAMRFGMLGFSAGAGVDPWNAVGHVLGDHAALALLPTAEGNDPIPVLVTRVANTPGDQDGAGDTVDKLVSAIARLSGIERRGRINPDHLSPMHGGTLLRISDELAIGRHGSLLVVSPSVAAVEEVLQHADRPDPVRVRAVNDMRRDIPRDARAWLTGNDEIVSLAQSQIPAMTDNPLSALLLGGWFEAVRQVDAPIAWLDVRDGTIRIRSEGTLAGPLDPPYRAFLAPETTTRGIDFSEVPGHLGEMAVHRSLADMVTHRETLMTLPAANGFVEFTNNMSALMGGTDIIDTIYGRVQGPIRVVAARRRGHAGGDGTAGEVAAPIAATPELPAFAMVMTLNDPPNGLDAQLRSGAVALMSVLNIERRQENLSGMLLDSIERHGVKASVGRFVAPPDGAEAGMEHNFAPALTLHGNQLIVSSDPELLFDLVAAMGNEDARTELPARDTMVIDGPELTALLVRNRDALVAARMLEDGLTRQQAAAATDELLEYAGLVRRIRTDATIDGTRARAELRIELDPSIRRAFDVAAAQPATTDGNG
ncbi:MAG: hypothetical protein AB8G96_15650 [Phycisphaerales bacterium]